MLVLVCRPQQSQFLGLVESFARGVRVVKKTNQRMDLTTHLEDLHIYLMETPGFDKTEFSFVKIGGPVGERFHQGFRHSFSLRFGIHSRGSTAVGRGQRRRAYQIQGVW